MTAHTLLRKENQPEASAELRSRSAVSRSAATPSGDGLQATLNQSPRVQSLLQLQRSLDQSPRVVTQAKRAEALSQPKQAAPLQAQANKTGLPDGLKAGVENLSGMSLDDVQVHYNSSRPAQMQALAHTQGSDIHVAPGQERQLAHETWHVVQQKQGRVRPTAKLSGVPINDDPGLEREADLMGARATRAPMPVQRQPEPGAARRSSPIQFAREAPIQFGRKNRGGNGGPSRNDLKQQRQFQKYQQKLARKHQQHIEQEALRPPRVRGGSEGGGNPLLGILLLMMLAGAYGAEVGNNIRAGRSRDNGPRRIGGSERRSNNGGASGAPPPDNSRAVAIYRGPPTPSLASNTTGLSLPRLFSGSWMPSLFSTGNITGAGMNSGPLVEWRPPGVLERPSIQRPGPATSPQVPSSTRRQSSPLFEGLDTLRIGVQHAGGFGHQDAAVAMMQELESLGFAGQLHMIFQNITGMEGVPTALKLAQLLPGFDPHNANQTLPFGGLNLLATEQELFSSTTSPEQRLPLGLVGASDNDGTAWLDALNVEQALMLQPYGWATDEDERYLLSRTSPDRQSLGLPLSSTYQYPVTDPWEETPGGPLERYAALERFAQSSMQGKPEEQQAKLPGLLQILNATRTGSSELMPVYGLHYFKKIHKEQEWGGNVLFNLAAGSRGFLRQQQAPRPVIMAILSDLADDVPLGINTTSAEIDSPDLSDTLRGLSPYDVLALKVGQIPRELFQLLYKSATLPGTFEGANTANLLQLLGKPFLSVYEGMTSLPEGGPDVSSGFSVVSETSNALKEGVFQDHANTLQNYLQFEPQLPREIREQIRQKLGSGDVLNPREQQDMASRLARAPRSSPQQAESSVYEVQRMLTKFARLSLSPETREALRDFDAQDSHSPRAQKRMNTLITGMTQGIDDWFARPLVGARTPSSDVARYYESVHEEAVSDDNRQVLRALEFYQQHPSKK